MAKMSSDKFEHHKITIEENCVFHVYVGKKGVVENLDYNNL